MEHLTLAELPSVPSLETNFDGVIDQIIDTINSEGPIAPGTTWTVSLDIKIGVDVDQHTLDATPVVESVKLSTTAPPMPVEQFRSGRIILNQTADVEA